MFPRSYSRPSPSAKLVQANSGPQFNGTFHRATIYQNQTLIAVCSWLMENKGGVPAGSNDGSLKGKKIGSAWRITRGALEDFLKN